MKFASGRRSRRGGQSVRCSPTAERAQGSAQAPNPSLPAPHLLAAPPPPGHPCLWKGRGWASLVGSGPALVLVLLGAALAQKLAVLREARVSPGLGGDMGAREVSGHKLSDP